MKKRSGKGAFGRSRCNRPARRRVSINTNIAIGAPLIVGVVLTILFAGIKTGLVAAGIGVVVCACILAIWRQHRDLQES